MSKMNKKARSDLWVSTALAVLLGTGFVPASLDGQLASIAPANMPRIGKVDERFQSFNVEMVEITGGRFWKPYRKQTALPLNVQPSAKQSGANPVGMDPAIYQQRP